MGHFVVDTKQTPEEHLLSGIMSGLLWDDLSFVREARENLMSLETSVACKTSVFENS